MRGKKQIASNANNFWSLSFFLLTDIGKVQHFVYLGGTANKTGGTDEEIKTRKAKARHTFCNEKASLEQQQFSLQTKLKIFNRGVKPFFLYSAKTWRLIKTLLFQP